MTEYTFEQLIDVDQVRQLLESHHQISGMAYGLFDNNENDIVSAGGQEICTRFHRAHPVCSERCRESNAYIKSHLREVEDCFIEYRCGNGMIDVAMPIIIEGRHLATFFIGQFFYDDDPPARTFFLDQAREFGFDPDDYLAALDMVPLFSREHIRANVMFMHSMVRILAESELKSLRLANEMQQRDRMEAGLKESEARYWHSSNLLASILESASSVSVYALDREYRYLAFNQRHRVEAKRLWGADIAVGMSMLDAIDTEGHREFCRQGFDKVLAGHSFSIESREVIVKDGQQSFEYRDNYASPIFSDDGVVVGLTVFVINITERKRIEELLHRREQEFRAVVENSPDVISRFDRECRRIYVNPALARLLGRPMEEVIGTRPTDISFLPEAARFEQIIRDVWESGAKFQGEIPIRSSTGELRWGDARVVPELGPDGQIVSVLSIGRDITARRRMEDELAARERQFRALAENSPDPIYRYDRDFRRLYINPVVARILGKPVEELIGGTPADGEILVSEQSRKVMDAVSRVFDRNETEQIDLGYVARDGQHRDYHMLLVPERDADDRVVTVLALARDITAVRDAERRMTRFLAGVPGFVYSFRMSPEGHFSFPFASPGIEKIYGLRPDDVRDDWTPLRALSHPDDAPRIHDAIVESARTMTTFREEFRVRPPGLPECWIEAYATPERETEGGILWHGVMLDITERKQAEEELRKYRDHLEELIRERTAELTSAKEQADAANRAKSAFLANMSHELRTPLNAVLGFSQLMKSAPDVTTAQKENLEIITRSGEHLLTLINNVLDLSKIESGLVELEESPLDLRQMMKEMASLMGSRAREKGLDFAPAPSPDLPRHIAADGGKLRQVLLNLIGNAIKNTRTGRVTLRAMLTNRETPERVRVRFDVADTGPGIHVEDRERIFFPFVQLGGQSPTEAGSGLGLAICKQYVELMGGEIGVAGEPGEGAVFHFEIPVTVLPSEAAPAELRLGRVTGIAEGEPRYRILIAEDQPENRLLLRKLLEPFGFDLREAVNGEEVVALFREWCPHLIFMDIRMPVMDGLEATRRIRAADAGVHARIIAITAHALEEERREILAAGCDGVIRKPYRDAEIYDALTKHLRVRLIYTEVEPSVPAPVPLDAAALTGLPDEQLKVLEQALVRIDIDAVNRAIENIRTCNSPLADALASAARELQFGRILRLIRSTHGEPGPEDET